MNIRHIRTDGDHSEALREIERLWTYPDDSPENDKLDVLATLVEVYETELASTGLQPGGNPAICGDRYWHTQADLLGSHPMASELSRAIRRISLAVAQTISAAWGVPIQLLVAPYAAAD